MSVLHCTPTVLFASFYFTIVRFAKLTPTVFSVIKILMHFNDNLAFRAAYEQYFIHKFSAPSSFHQNENNGSIQRFVNYSIKYCHLTKILLSLLNISCGQQLNAVKNLVAQIHPLVKDCIAPYCARRVKSVNKSTHKIVLCVIVIRRPRQRVQSNL